MRIAIISTYTHPSRLHRKERSIMQSSVPELLAALCPPDAEIELYNEKETDIPLDRDWDLVFFSYLHAYYEHNVLRDPELVRLMGLAGCRYVYTGLESLNPESISSMNKGQNKLSEVREVIQRAFASGIVLSFGLLVGADGDTNEYLERVPEYLHDLGDHCPTFLGIVCPYPETPFFAQVAAEGRLLPGVTSRDLDGYTLCHRPARLHPSEAIEHFQRLSRTLGSLPSVGRHLWGRLRTSDLPRYKKCVVMSAPEVLSLRAPLANRARSYIAGRDPIEAWDAARMRELGLEPQRIDASSCRADPRGLARIRSGRAGRAAAVA